MPLGPDLQTPWKRTIGKVADFSASSELLFFFAGTYLKQIQYLYDGYENTPSAIYLSWLHVFNQHVFSEKAQGHNLNAPGQTILTN